MIFASYFRVLGNYSLNKHFLTSSLQYRMKKNLIRRFTLTNLHPY
jgi:hypothetical protein